MRQYMHVVNTDYALTLSELSPLGLSTSLESFLRGICNRSRPSDHVTSQNQQSSRQISQV